MLRFLTGFSIDIYVDFSYFSFQASVHTQPNVVVVIFVFVINIVVVPVTTRMG